MANVLEEGLTDPLAGPHALVHDAGGDFLLHAEVAAECGDVAVDPDLEYVVNKVVGECPQTHGVAVDAQQVFGGCVERC